MSKKTMVVDKEMLTVVEGCVCLNEDVYKEISRQAKAIDDVAGEGDYFDHLLVDKGMLTMMKEVWAGGRESFAVVITSDSIDVL